MNNPRLSPSVLHVSHDLIKFLKDWEGCELRAYRDSAGIWTIGVGHIDGVTAGMTITMAEAEAFLREDLAEAEAAVKKLVKVPLRQNEYDALVSWQFNTGGLKGSTLLAKLNAGDYRSVDDQMRRWNKAKDPATGKRVAVRGLTFRRLSESEMWAVADYAARNESAPYWETNQIPTPPSLRLDDEPVHKQPAMQVTAYTAAGASAQEAVAQLSPLAEYSDIIRYAILALTIGAVAFTLYRSFKGR